MTKQGTKRTIFQTVKSGCASPWLTQWHHFPKNSLCGPSSFPRLSPFHQFHHSTVRDISMATAHLLCLPHHGGTSVIGGAELICGPKTNTTAVCTQPPAYTSNITLLGNPFYYICLRAAVLLYLSVWDIQNKGRSGNLAASAVFICISQNGFVVFLLKGNWT